MFVITTATCEMCHQTYKDSRSDVYNQEEAETLMRASDRFKSWSKQHEYHSRKEIWVPDDAM